MFSDFSSEKIFEEEIDSPEEEEETVDDELINDSNVSLILACKTDSSQAATEYASEHSNHGKHCHHKIEYVVEQHSKQNHSHDA